MKNDTYTYKQILIGLRNEFLEAQRKLEELKDYVIIFDKNSDNYYFDLYKSPYENKLPELTINRIVNEQDAHKLLTLLRDTYGYKKPTRAIMLRDNNGNYYPRRKSYFKKGEFEIVVKDTRKKEFGYLAEELLNSDFAKFMTLDRQIISAGAETKPRIVPDSFRFDLVTEKSVISYLGREDILRFSSAGKPVEKWEPLAQEHLDCVSKIEFMKSDFSEYHQNIIEKNINDDRGIVLYEDYQPSTYAKFKIHEDSKQLVLTKLQKNK